MTETTEPECYRYEGVFYVRDRHEHDCEREWPNEDPSQPPIKCAGCEICHRHCTCRKACPEHVDPSNPLTAPACIGRARDNLRAILKLLPDLTPEAIIVGINSEAAVLSGPALNTPETIEAHGYRQLSIVFGRIKGDVEPHSNHPLIVLGWWEAELRKAYGQELPDHRPDCIQTFRKCDGCQTITEYSAASYLETVLDHVAQDRDHEFSKLSTELSDCRAHLEVILHASRRPETGAPCPTCTANLPTGSKAKIPQLRKVYAEHKDLTLKVANRACELGQTVDEATGRSLCPICRGDEDTWRCPDDSDHVWSDEDYRRRVDSGYLVHSAALTATQMFEVYQIEPSTLRTWVSRKKVKRRGRNDAGQQLYDVADAVANRDGSTTHQETA